MDVLSPPIISLILGIVAVAVGAAVFIIRLEGRINLLEQRLGQIEEHPLLVLHKKWASSPKGVAAFYGDVLGTREIEEDKDE